MQTLFVLLGDPALPDSSKPGGRFTDDDLQQVERLRQALSESADLRFEYWNDHRLLIDRLRDDPPAFVLNLCDTGFENHAARELHVPALLELFAIPYSGSGPLALGLCYDKALVRGAASALGVPVPDEVRLGPREEMPAFTYPAFVKPNRGDGSVGITTAAVVADADAARARISALRHELPGVDILVQEFLSGDEYGVGLVGNPETGMTALPPLEVDYSALDPALPRLLDYSSKVDPESPYWNDVHFRAARLTEADVAAMKSWCEALFARLGLRDYARFDFRADGAGRLKLMEVNPNPAWCWDGKLALMGKLAGLSQGAVLRRIIDAAQARLGVSVS